MPARGLFRIHLSTAIVLMVVAGALLWMNCLGPTTFRSNKGYPAQYGWPYPIYDFLIYLDSEEATLAPPLPPPNLLWKPLIADACVVFAILLGSSVVCEWRIRRREAKTP